jgi:hypothetical protein
MGQPIVRLPGSHRLSPDGRERAAGVRQVKQPTPGMGLAELRPSDALDPQGVVMTKSGQQSTKADRGGQRADEGDKSSKGSSGSSGSGSSASSGSSSAKDSGKQSSSNSGAGSSNNSSSGSGSKKK